MPRQKIRADHLETITTGFIAPKHESRGLDRWLNDRDLVEPVRLDSKVVLPEGTLLEGKVVKNDPPRLRSRAGSLLLAFTRLALPGGVVAPVVASVTGPSWITDRIRELISKES